ncbi:thiol:disulfide interchange protein DsbA/DsbL [Aquisalimonas lutea]|uniref:thiol:disulfide interchange protein DsbA/DsbL n=1 Tax=Aquisalimonas lutea TaxID=1327750 RepID=UPI0025B3BF33|nr:thiol:disulfide interchange protein DsbA/DsbL [Aquisalimonas lutea]MDN3516497.1 thiol:disulfide interchange protein DsbA/DsbL [Aquisalimonas lutea]
MQGIHKLLATLLLVVPALAWGQSFQAGEDYRELDEPVSMDTGEVVQVREFFSYACPHCNSFNPRMHSLMEDLGERAELVRTPVVFNRSWEPVARAYHATAALDAVEATHDALFRAIHDEGRRLQSVDAVADVVAEQGVDPEAFKEAWDSFTVDASMRRAQRVARTYGVRSTPTVAVAGKYVVDVRQAGGQQRMTEVIRYLVDREYDDAQ